VQSVSAYTTKLDKGDYIIHNLFVGTLNTIFRQHKINKKRTPNKYFILLRMDGCAALKLEYNTDGNLIMTHDFRDSFLKFNEIPDLPVYKFCLIEEQKLKEEILNADTMYWVCKNWLDGRQYSSITKNNLDFVKYILEKTKKYI